MDFIERWLQISPDGGSGAAEALIVAVVLVTVVSMIAVALRNYFPRNVIDYLEQLGKRESSERFDN